MSEDKPTPTANPDQKYIFCTKHEQWRPPQGCRNKCTEGSRKKCRDYREWQGNPVRERKPNKKPRGTKP